MDEDEDVQNEEDHHITNEDGETKKIFFNAYDL